MADQSGTKARQAAEARRQDGIDGSAQFQAAKGAPPRTDTMTIVLHWVTAIGIAADNPRAVVS